MSDAQPRPSPGARERRKHPRVEAAWPLTLRLASGEHRARLRDVSRAGVSFYLERPVQPMTVLELDLELPGDTRGRRLRGRGAVVRCERISKALEHYEVAVFLHDMREEDREAIDAFVSERAARAANGARSASAE